MYKMITAAMLIMVLGILSLSCGAKTNSAAAANQVAGVQRGNLNISILASGNLETAHEENLSFYSAGTVAEVLVKIGDHVEVGQVLAKLDTAPLESSLAQAQINVKSAQQALENAQTPTTNSSGAVIAAPDPLTIEIKQLQLQNSKANLAEAQKSLDKATIIAPFAGLVTDVNVVPGDQVSANAVGVRIIDPENFQTEVLVNETEIYQLSIGTPATVQVVALPGYSFPARVALMAETPTIASNVVNYKVTVQMDPVGATASQNQTTPRTFPGTASGNQTAPGNQAVSGNQTSGQQSARRSYTGQASATSGQLSRQQSQTTTALPAGLRLREGLTVTISIVTEERNSVLLVPNRAITSRGGKYYVQVVSASGVTEERVIQAGITDGQNTEVISGLSEGDQVSIASNAAASTTTSTSTQQRTQTPSITGGGIRIPGVTTR